MNTEAPFSYIAIEGNIASGKTSLVTELKRELGDISINLEPVEEWRRFPFGVDLIEKFGKGERGAAMGLQVAALSCFEEMLRGLEGERVVVTERSVTSSYKVFGRVNWKEDNLGLVEWSVLTFLYNKLPEWMRSPQLTIYIVTPAEICRERMLGRGRTGEAGLSLDYLSKLEKEHVSMLDEARNWVIRIDGTWEKRRVFELASITIKGFLKGENKQVSGVTSSPSPPPVFVHHSSVYCPTINYG